MSEPKIHLDLSTSRAVTFAGEQAGIPIIQSAVIRNDGDEPLTGATLTVQLVPDLGEPLTVPVSRVGGGESVELPPIDLRLPPDHLRGLVEAERARLIWSLQRDEERLASGECEVELLAHNEWPRRHAPLSLLASFVTPNHPVIAAVLRRTADRLRELTGNPALSDYQSRSRARVVEMVQALYETLQSLGLTYVTTPASFELSGQKIRLAPTLLAEQFGNCLDITVLAASCLEQMGLRPLLVVVEGHALPGVWLVEQEFPEGEVVDAARLRNARALENLLLFDSSTLVEVPRRPLTEAVRVAERELADDDRFRFAIDVRVARRAGFRPLPLRVEVASTSEQPEREESAGASESLASTILREAREVEVPVETDAKPTPPAEPDSVARRFDRWRERLLDLSLRNRLLNFQPDQRRNFRLDVPDLARLEDLLAQKKLFELIGRPRSVGDDTRDATLAAARVDPEVVKAERLADLERGTIHVQVDQDHLPFRARELERSARLALEEGGASTLFLAVGLLRWFETGSSQQARYAPILLVPVELGCDRTRAKVLLRQIDEDAIPNVTLIEHLRRDFDIDLSGLATPQTDDAGLDVTSCLRLVREMIASQPRWEVLDEAHLGLFSFTKFLMWRDLGENRDALLDNPVVRHIAMGGSAQLPPQPDPADPQRLDDEVPPASLPTVVDADSTQLAAVVSALRGRSFVLQGPPGTGKSQTITNLIAAALGQGKSVLFVSEKMAALEVVQRRLEQAGLGDFCLELHSHKANKKQVVEALGRTLERARSTQNLPWEERSGELQSLRSRLNEEPRALHAPRPLGQSFYRASGRLLALRKQGAREVVLDLPEVAELTEASLRESLATAAEFAAAAREVEPISDHPWRDCGIADWSEQRERSLRTTLESMRTTLGGLRSASAELASSLGVPTPTSGDGMGDLSALGAALGGGPLPREIESASAWGELSRRAWKWCEAARLHRSQSQALAVRWTDGLYALDLPNLAVRFQRWAGAFFLFALLFLWSARRLLKGVAQAGLPTNRVIADDLALARRVREAAPSVESERAALAASFAGCWDGDDPDALEALLRRCDAVAGTLRRYRASSDAPLDRALALTDPAVPDARRDTLQEQAARLAKLLDAWNDQRRTLDELVRPSEFPSRAAPDLIGAAEPMLARWTDGLPSFRAWCAFRRHAIRMEERGLGPIVRAFQEGEMKSSEVEMGTECSLLSAWVAAVRDREPALRDFDGPARHRAIERFRALDTEHVRLGSAAITNSLVQRLPHAGVAPDSSEPGVLLREMRKRTRHMPIRRLLAQIPNLLTRLKPCLMMSPLSVAQFLPAGGRRFDLVVFDEASQICTHDAIGAIGRGNQVIVVGDSRQLPPTSFFQKSVGEEEAVDENEVVELESILEEALSCGLPQQSLGWHYRSRHQTLIQFSNEHFYDNDLSVFPAARSRVADLGVRWQHVPGGVYEKGGERINRAEARAVVDALVAELRVTEPEQRTFGVVTFSQAQQTHIEDLLEEARRDPLVERHFSRSLIEPVFVKNLENVQGDERDVILFSVGYGPDEKGRLWMNFGPLNRAGGERRLNVAVTRARERLVVYSTLTADQIDLSRTQSKGARLLKSFLRYAQEQSRLSGPLAQGSSGEFDSDFERDVHDALVAKGYRVDSQVGCGRYRIDLAIVDPQEPGRYLLGVECDGAAYHSAATARDRDRLRQQVLENLGWRLHRIWSTDWWFRRDAELARLEEAIAAAEAQRNTDRPQRVVEIAPVAPEIETEAEQVAAASPTRSEPRPYKYAVLDQVGSSPEEMYEIRNLPRLRDLANEVVTTEAPLHLDELTRRIASAFGAASIGRRMRERIVDVLATLPEPARVEDEFVWRADQDPVGFREFRGPPEDGEPRSFERIPLEEIAAAARHLLDAALSLDESELVRETARIFGIGRVGRNVRERAQRAIGLLIERGEAGRDGERITVGS